MKALCSILFLVQFSFIEIIAQTFVKQKEIGIIRDEKLNEISGIAASTTKKNCFWVHNDSGDSARIFLINKNGKLKGTVSFNENVKDCEDIAVGIGKDNDSYVYLADIGDNAKWRGKVFIFVFKEKDLVKAISKSHIDVYKKTTLEYEDGMFNAEALMIDNIDSLLYIVTKDKQSTFLYFAKLRDIFNRDKVVLNRIAQLSCTNITAGDISKNGKEILLKNYDSIFYWKRNKAEPVFETLKRNAIIVSYKKEGQGEAICFDDKNAGFYTVSEDKFSPIYFFKRKK
jgi:hypothetical protein